MHEHISHPREQRDQVDLVIEALESIVRQQTPRRCRPPKWLTVNRINALKNGTSGLANGSPTLAALRKPANNSIRATSGGIRIIASYFLAHPEDFLAGLPARSASLARGRLRSGAPA